jgi:hypothetical protein
VTGALISLASSLITSTFNYRLSRRQWLEQEQHEAQKELQKSLTHGLEDVRRQGLGPLRGNNDAIQDAGLLPREVANLEVDTKGLIQALNSKDTASVKIEYLLQLALEIDKTDSH